jgi:hypothetical protein
VTRKTRIVAWVVLVALAAYQAYAQRYVIGPDGISYLDLSDAVVTGHWARLVNLYWSPAYPLLVGVARRLTNAGPATEIQVVHAVNLVCFAAMFGAFDYMLISILSLARRTRNSMLGGPMGGAASYFLFGCCALVMLPLELTTPDLLNAAAAFAVFGAILRLRDDESHSPRAVRHAVVLGAALGAGALIKSFMVPWAVVCLAVMAFAMRRRGQRPVIVATAVWLLFLLPWSAVMTKAAGRPTFGDAGRLTYAWYVNEQNAPSAGGVPPGVRRPNTERILPGVGVPADTNGSDPMWFDPARWNKSVVPHFDLGQQLGMIKVFELFYIQNLSPLLFVFLLIAVAPRGSRRESWWEAWVVYIPVLAALGAYAMVIVTTRYVLAFILAGLLTLLATLPRPRRMLPLLFLFGLLLPVGLEAMQPETINGLSLIASLLGGLLAGVLLPTKRRVLWVVGLGVATAATRMLLPSAIPDVLRIGSVLLVGILWRASFAAVRTGRTVRFAERAEVSLGLLIALLLLVRLGLRLDQDTSALRRAASPDGGNAPVAIAQELQANGILPGARVAVIGPHAESYWVRSGRMHIVANVPRTLASNFWTLSAAGRDSLLNEFAKAGATVAIASMGPESGAPDSSWTPIRYNGWIRRLP